MHIQGINEQRLGLIGYPPFAANYVPVFLDAAGRTLIVPAHTNIDCGNGSSVISLRPPIAQKLDIGTSALPIQDGWFGRDLHYQAGTSAVWPKPGGAIYQSLTDATSSGTSETDLWNQTIAASVLSADGHSYHFMFAGQITGHATNSQRLRVYVTGNSIFDSTAQVVATTQDYVIEGWIIRNGTETARAIVRLSAGAPIAAWNYVTYTAVPSGNAWVSSGTLKLTGTVGGTGGTNLAFRMGRIYHEPAIP